MKTIVEINNDFGKNFLLASIIYLPHSLVNHLEDDKKQLFEDIVDIVFVIENNGHNYFMDENMQFCAYHILPKKALLDDNIFMLLKYREEYPKPTFDFILLKYIELFEGYRYLSQWLFENVDRYIKNINSDINQGFELQFATFCRHGEEIRQHFPAHCVEIPLSNLDLLKEDGMSQLGSIIGNDDLAQLFTNDLKKPLDSLAKRKEHIKNLKKGIMASSDKLILEKVFNIRPKDH